MLTSYLSVAHGVFAVIFLQPWWLIDGNNTVPSLGRSLWNEWTPAQEAERFWITVRCWVTGRSISSSPAPEPSHSLCSLSWHHMAWGALWSPLLWVCGCLQRLVCCPLKEDWVQLSHELCWSLVKFFNVLENEIITSHSLFLLGVPLYSRAVVSLQWVCFRNTVKGTGDFETYLSSVAWEHRWSSLNE